MVELMQAEGLPYGDRSMTYNSTLAQEFAAWAFTFARDSQSPQNAIDQLDISTHDICDAIYRAYFVDNINIASPDELVAIAERLGLPVDVANDVLQGRQFQGHVNSDWMRSKQLGITGVPMFVIENQGISGAQPYEVLVDFVTQCGARPLTS